MTGRTHLVAGANAAGWGLWLLTGMPASIWWIGLGALGGLFPDLDASDSLLQNADLRSGQRGLRIQPLKLPGLVLNALFGHRGFLHSLLALILLIAAFALARPPIELIAAFGLGYISHLFLDGINPSGVPLFYPFKRRIRFVPFVRIRTGGLIDQLLFLGLSPGLVGLLALSIPRLTVFDW